MRLSQLSTRQIASCALFMTVSLLIAVAALPRAVHTQGLEPQCADGGASVRFGGTERIAMTYFYYWYEPEDREDPRLAIHPPAGAPFDWRDPAWHRHELSDMAYAGIDVALAAYWGDVPNWSTGGLGPMVAAREALLEDGVRPPAIGLFLDTNLYSLLLADNPRLADLTTDEGLEALVGQIMGFFDRVSPCHRATVGGRPLIFLWRADTEDGDVLQFDQDAIDALHDRLEALLGSRPIIVRERTWDSYAKAAGTTAVTDAKYGWGSALRGVLFDGDLVAVGPGYDDRLFPERPGYLRERDDARRYADDLRVAAASGASWLLVETWNELWEGTAVAASEEHGRLYLDVTRDYLALFRELQGESPRDGWVDLATGESSSLHVLAEAVEEHGIPEESEGRWGARPHLEADGNAYFHFALQPGVRHQVGGRAVVVVEYFDERPGTFSLEYDSHDSSAPDGGSYKETAQVTVGTTRRWLSYRFELPDARFERSQYLGYGDFRIRDEPADGGPSHLFGRVFISLQPAPRPILLAPELLHLVDASSRGMELRWLAVAGAPGYGVEVVPMHDPESGIASSSRERLPCGSSVGPTGRLRAFSGQASCRVEGLTGARPGLYRWRVQVIDGLGQPLGGPSDWGYFWIER